jgi:hypothetical protein
MAQLTINDVNQYITMIRINFENAYRAQTAEEREMLLASWYAILQNYPKEVCDAAVLNAIKNAEYAPRIGAVVKEIERMQAAYEKTDAELWGELKGCMREVAECAYRFRFTYVELNGLSQGDNARLKVKEIFNGLSPELKEYCRNPSGLIELAQLNDEQLNFEKGRFNKAMPVLKERAKTRAQIGTSDLCGIIHSMSNNFLLEG